MSANSPSVKQSIFIVQGGGIRPATNFKSVSFVHPKHAVLVRYLLLDNEIYEVQRLKHKPSSWFIDDTVEEDGSIFLCTRVEPLFVVLPLLERSRRKSESQTQGVFSSLTEILSDEHVNAQILLGCKSLLSSLDRVCDVKSGWDEKVYRLDDAKVVEFFRQKTVRLCNSLLRKTKLGPVNADLSKDAGENPEVARLALTFMADYLSDAWLQRLCSCFSLTVDDLFEKRPIDQMLTADVDTTRVERDAKRKEVAKQSTAVKKLQKINTTGMKSLSSYFSAPNKNK